MYICKLDEKKSHYIKKITILYKLKKFYLINKNVYIEKFINN